ncbi:hypothetical protein ZEAMMB73_Zm00001d013756 [Zea mays]|uniref:Uncharacterized protein n=1 Tax=Zea mays TaxID=4577 RepID=A0A1D6GLW4_MAIZE|nr:hypothetical protein ZEAMMB73_Zm00001d013756 [Zea mays]
MERSQACPIYAKSENIFKRIMFPLQIMLFNEDE